MVVPAVVAAVLVAARAVAVAERCRAKNLLMLMAEGWAEGVASRPGGLSEDAGSLRDP
jgi:hypothetical protein